MIQLVLLSLTLSLTIFLFILNTAIAICPLCTIAVGAGVSLSRWLGCDDLISGSWIGGLAMSTTIWLKLWLENKGIRFLGKTPLLVILCYTLIVIPLYYGGFIHDEYNSVYVYEYVWDKLIFGILCGSIAVVLGIITSYAMKKYNKDHVYFPFQKVVIPIISLFLVDAALYFAFLT